MQKIGHGVRDDYVNEVHEGTGEALITCLD